MNYDQKPHSKEKKYITPTKEQMEFLEEWLKKNPYEIIPMEMRRDYEKEKNELEVLFTEFKKNHSLEDLNALVHFPPKPEDTAKYIIRIIAKNELIPIVALLNTLHDQTNISESDYNKLKLEYKILSNAVGIINGGKIDHNR